MSSFDHHQPSLLPIHQHTSQSDSFQSPPSESHDRSQPGNPILHPTTTFPLTSPPTSTSTSTSTSVSTMMNNQKRVRQRSLRACDTCRKMKIKCVMNTVDPPCEACKLTSRPCKFEHIGVKREKPPSTREIEQLNRKIASLETILFRLRPNIDLSSLPRTNDQAKTMANAFHDPSIDLQVSMKEEDDHELDKHLLHQEHEDDEDDDEEDDESFDQMLTQMGLCQLAQCPLIDHDQCSHPKDHISNQDHVGVDGPKPNPVNEDRSFAERFAESHCFEHSRDNYWPELDLADKLIKVFFEKIHPYPPILLESDFMNHYRSGLADQDSKFRKLSYAVFAVASPYCEDDPRVLYHPQSTQTIHHPRQSAGALYAFAALDSTPKPGNFITLIELQTMALLSIYLLAMSNPRHTFAIVTNFLRHAISSGAHLSSSPRWNSSFLLDQLRKRAFLTMITVEKHTSSSLGYLTIPRYQSNLITPPVNADDATLELLNQQFQLLSTTEARKKLEEKIVESVRTPREVASKALWCIRTKLESKYQSMILNQLSSNNNPQSSSSTSTPASTSSTPSHTTTDGTRHSKFKSDRRLFLFVLSGVVSDFIDNEIPALARWNPSLSDSKDLFATGYCNCLIRAVLIRVNLEILSEYKELIKSTFQAASISLDILEDLRALGRLNIFYGTVPYLLGPIGLFFLWVISQEDHPYLNADLKATAWIRITKCVEMLKELTPTSFISERLCLKFTEYLQHLKEEISQSTIDTSNPTIPSSNPKKRPFSEIMAKKVEVPSVSNFLYSLNSSPIDQRSQTPRTLDQEETLNLAYLTDLIKTNTTDPLQFPDWNADLNLFSTAVSSIIPKNPDQIRNNNNSQQNPLDRLTSGFNFSLPIENWPRSPWSSHDINNWNPSSWSSLRNQAPITNISQIPIQTGNASQEIAQNTVMRRNSNHNNATNQGALANRPSSHGRFETTDRPTSIPSSTLVISDRYSHQPYNRIDQNLVPSGGHPNNPILNIDNNHPNLIGNIPMRVDSRDNQQHTFGGGAGHTNTSLNSSFNSSTLFSTHSINPIPHQSLDQSRQPIFPSADDPSGLNHSSPRTGLITSDQLSSLSSPLQTQTHLNTFNQTSSNFNNGRSNIFDIKIPKTRSVITGCHDSVTNFGIESGFKSDSLNQQPSSQFIQSSLNLIEPSRIQPALPLSPSIHFNHNSNPIVPSSKNSPGLPPPHPPISTNTFALHGCDPLKPDHRYSNLIHAIEPDDHRSSHPNLDPQKVLNDDCNLNNATLSFNPQQIDVCQLDVSDPRIATTSLINPTMATTAAIPANNTTLNSSNFGFIDSENLGLGISSNPSTMMLTNNTVTNTNVNNTIPLSGLSICPDEVDVNEIFSSICDTWLI